MLPASLSTAHAVLPEAGSHRAPLRQFARLAARFAASLHAALSVRYQRPVSELSEWQLRDIGLTRWRASRPREQLLDGYGLFGVHPPIQGVGRDTRHWL